MPADLFVYALVAAGLVFWLRNILGTRHGDERQRPGLSPVKDMVDKRTSGSEEDDGPEIRPENRIRALFEDQKGVCAIENKTAEKNLLEILKADKRFDIDFFFEGAQDAFAIIVEAFADGDSETLKDLLAPSVYKAFEAEIKAREARGETQDTEIHAIEKAEITEARRHEGTAYITLRFVAEETSVTRDKNGEIIAGHPDRTTAMRDIWVFGRNLKSRDPRWLVYETRGDFEGDNDIIPDTEE